MKIIEISELSEWTDKLTVGEEVLLNGYVYTARDAVHKKFSELVSEGKELPIDVRGAVIYYAGPTPSKNGMAVGSCGPTTSSRMDKHTPMLLDMGLGGIIGKGERNSAVVESIKKNKAVYFCALGGAGALYANCIKSCEVIAFENLGCESLKKMKVENFPVYVAVDCHGGNIFEKTK
ncbi:MAG: fumarate hydratase C-terminal domain-containing protein [Clostridia bacterium]|nr:fumarate hydratase C-terminal domain-containing protein [Clostridia bacterium]